MKRLETTAIALIAVLGLTNGVGAAASPADGPNDLEATLQFIQQKLTDNATLQYTASGRKPSDNTTFKRAFGFRASDVRTDVAACKLSYHLVETLDSAQVPSDVAVSFSSVSQALAEPVTHWLSVMNQQYGLIYTSTEPAVSAVVTRAFPNQHFFALFADPNVAAAVARAIAHAGELCGGHNRQAQASQARKASKGPGLEATFKFIQDKLGDIGRQNYVAVWRNSSDGNTGQDLFMAQFSNLQADETTCSLAFSFTGARDGVVYNDSDYGFFFKDAQSVVVEPTTQRISNVNAQSGSPNVTTISTTPTTISLEVRLPHNASQYFEFTDSDLADRVAKAMTHAIELCGGGNKDPF
ncbi:MAG TPA: hypothetical protein VME21_09755 [Steroidobacteraceae bacterium]|nr:hypothetical protein [Steroidobacteraceae bacterium]